MGYNRFGQKEVSRVRQLVAVLAVTLAATALGGSAVRAQSAENESSAAQITYHLGCKEGNCVVPPWSVDAPSVPEFPHLGMTLDAKNQPLSFLERWSYRRALSKFPDALSCLKKDAANSQGADLTKVDWALMKNRTQVEVCLTRIHNAIADSKKSVTWFQAVGFSAFSNTNPKGHFREGWSTVHANWKGDGISPFRSLSFLLEETSAYGMSIGITIQENGVVNNSQVAFLRL